MLPEIEKVHKVCTHGCCLKTILIISLVHFVVDSLFLLEFVVNSLCWKDFYDIVFPVVWWYWLTFNSFFEQRKERLLKKQHRQALLLDNFLSVDGLGPGRSLRDRKPVTYTFGNSSNDHIYISFLHISGFKGMSLVWRW